MANNPPAEPSSSAEGDKAGGEGGHAASASASASAEAPLRPAPTAASMPLELRLRALEARVIGVPDSQVSARGKVEEDETLVRRVRATQDAVRDAVSHTPEFQRFYDRYNIYAPFLRLGLDDPPTSPADGTASDDDESGAEGGSRRRTTPRDLLPPHAKLAMVLAAAGDLVDADRGLREIDVLNKRDVAGAGHLEDVVALAPALDNGRDRLAARRRTLEQMRADVASLVEQYTEFTTTVSDMFVELHEQITALEERVARAERRRAAELAETY